MTTILVLALIAGSVIGLVALFRSYTDSDSSAQEIRRNAAPRSFYAYLHDPSNQPTAIAYTPLGFNPTDTEPGGWPSSESIGQDLAVLRLGFDGLILRRFDSRITSTIVREAVYADYQAILLGIWDPRSHDEITGVANLIKTYGKAIALAVCVGNEGLAFNRYTLADVTLGIQQIRDLVGVAFPVPCCTSEPLWQYVQPGLQDVGDFLAPNIHPIFYRPDLPPSGAALWSREQALWLAQLARKPVLVKETGFPRAGAPSYSPEAQRRFWQAYTMDPHLTWLSEQPPVWISYAAAFDAFDQPVTVQQSLLPIEHAWGVLDHTRTPFPAFSIWAQQERDSSG